MAKLLTVIFLLIANTMVVAQDTTTTTQSRHDTVTITEDHAITREDDFSRIAILAFVGIGFMLVCIGIGVALTALAVLIMVGLISFGVITTSVLVGLHKNSFIKGFKTFIVLASAIGTTVIGGFAFWLMNKFGEWWSEKFAILSGAAVGLIAGLLLGFVALYVFQKLTTYFKKKFA